MGGNSWGDFGGGKTSGEILAMRFQLSATGVYILKKMFARGASAPVDFLSHIEIVPMHTSFVLEI